MPPKEVALPQNRRAVGLVVFLRAVDLPEMGWQRRLVAGTKVRVNSDVMSPEVPVPAMYRDGDTGELVVGARRYPIQGGVVESYELADAVKVAKT